MSNGRIPLEASRRERAAGTQLGPAPAPSTRLEVSILVRRRPGSGAQAHVEQIMRGEAPPMSRGQAAQTLGSDPADLQAVADFAKSQGLQVLDSNQATRTVRAVGTVAQMEAAFGVTLHTCQHDGRSYICYEGTLTIPESHEGIIEGVFGLDQKPAARER